MSLDKKFDLLVFIGRFQPFHNGHNKVIEQALRDAKHVLVLIGSANIPRNIRNPFTFQERKETVELRVDRFAPVLEQGNPDA